MKQPIILSIIPSSPDLSKSLTEDLTGILPNFFKEKNLHLDLREPIFNGTQYDTMKAMLECDVVVFDASVEWGETSGYDSNYKAATANPISDDHILVVSRTKLPINFVPMRCNIPILGEEEKIEINGVRQSKYHYTNQEIIKWLRDVNDFLRRLVFRQMKKMQRKMIAPGSKMGGIFKELTYKSFIQSINSHVYDPSFTENRVVSCPNCRGKGIAIEDFRNEKFIKDFIKTNSDDPDEMRAINERGFYCTSEQELEEIVSSGKWSCPKCNKTFDVVYRENNNQYRWWPMRMGQRTGPDGVIIEKMPVYEIL